MRLLTLATLVYAGVLVVVLVAVLSTIAVHLWLISRALSETRASLAGVRDRTAPLREHLSDLAALTDENVQRVSEATISIERALQQVLAPADATAG